MLRDWLPHQQDFIFHILARNAYPADDQCRICKKTGSLYRCLDCFGSGLFCLQCCLEHHIPNPFHSIQQWNGQYFAKTTLWEMGFVLHIGHGGAKCSAGGQMETGFTVVDVAGIHEHNISWCSCPEHPSKAIQLLQLGLYPASVLLPRTAFTFRALTYYHMDSVECNVSYSGFMTKLRRLTNLHSPNAVKVSQIFLMQLLCSYVLYRIDIRSLLEWPGNGTLFNSV